MQYTELISSASLNILITAFDSEKKKGILRPGTIIIPIATITNKVVDLS